MQALLSRPLPPCTMAPWPRSCSLTDGGLCAAGASVLSGWSEGNEGNGGEGGCPPRALTVSSEEKGIVTEQINPPPQTLSAGRCSWRPGPVDFSGGSHRSLQRVAGPHPPLGWPSSSLSGPHPSSSSLRAAPAAEGSAASVLREAPGLWLRRTRSGLSLSWALAAPPSPHLLLPRRTGPLPGCGFVDVAVSARCPPPHISALGTHSVVG